VSDCIVFLMCKPIAYIVCGQVLEQVFAGYADCKLHDLYNAAYV